MDVKPAHRVAEWPSRANKPALKGRIHESILDTIGNTPLVRLAKLSGLDGCKAELLGKLEFFNPLGSVKDRIGLAMIEAAEKEGRIGPDTVLIEPTSGNTGLALAFVCAAKGYRLILTMPRSMSEASRKLLLLMGAELEITPTTEGMRGAVRRAEEIESELTDALILQQFENPANPEIHRRTTAEEIWRDCEGDLDMVVGGIGTGGTLTGVGEVLKSRLPKIKVVAVEPEDSPVLSGGLAGPHKIQGIGPGFIPKILNVELIDEVMRIGSETAFAMARRAATLEGMPVGISSGAALAAAIEIGARRGMGGKRIVVILPSFAERYLSTPLFDNL
ncbi:MAG: cysteine synthase A [Proteobacteria bacterium]|jgi:cysteine synthase A|nr:cysteine synthase A [Pseudomonadota bacterium]MCH7634009.1 cysteine synthase A [Pseudomonadota bacterium]MCZ6744893.1 cysteine synthase A [Alphaproteobacteria bacterium]